MKNKLFNSLARIGRDAKGQTIVESLLCSIIIMIILVGLLQVFHLAIAKLLTDYSAFRTARSSCVGFKTYLLDRSARVAAIGASGKMLEAQNSTEFSSPRAQFNAEELMIPEYISGDRWLKYEYWFGENTYDTPYYYGYDTKITNNDDYVSPPNTILWNSPQTILPDIQENVVFYKYPFPFLDLFDRKRIIFSSIGESVDTIKGSSNMPNHAHDYLDE